MRKPGGMIMPHPPRDTRTFATRTGKAEFVASPIEVVHVPEGHVLLQTLRSHDQYNTTIYGLSDRYRGIEGGRKVVFVHPDDIAAFGLRDGDLVDITTRWEGDDVVRRVHGFRVVGYDTPRGSAAAYYPETNPLVPLDSTAIGSNTPTSKSVVVSLTPAAGPGAVEGASGTATDGASQDDTGSDQDHKKSRIPSTCPDWWPTPRAVTAWWRSTLRVGVTRRAARTQTLLAVRSKMPERLVPSRATATMMTIAMRATIRPYSTAVAPRSVKRAWNLMRCLDIGLFHPAVVLTDARRVTGIDAGALVILVETVEAVSRTHHRLPAVDRGTLRCRGGGREGTRTPDLSRVKRAL